MINILRNPSLNKGLNFTLEERAKLHLRGLLPPVVLSTEVQSERCLKQLRLKTSDLEKYIYLQTLQDTNESLYYRLLIQNTTELMPIVYTPTVGQACIEFSHIYRQTPRGLYLSLNDLGNVSEILDNWPQQDIKSIVFTDGERILGLGDLGINGMGIPIGKLALYTACAGVDPRKCLPILLDVGTNNIELLDDPFYMGLRQKRETGEQYDALVEELMNAARDKYGRDTVLQFEDFGNRNAFRLLRKYQDTHCTFNDDIQGTAAVVLAGLLSATPLTEKPLSEHTFLFMGAGEAGVGIADLIAMTISKSTGKTLEKAREQIWLVDSKGLVTASRINGLQPHKVAYAHEAPSKKTLEEAVDELKPSALIGVCTVANTFTQSICEKMAKNNSRPIIFALSNPTSKAECTAEEAYAWTNGNCVFASGSPFDSVEFNGKVFTPGQGNNAYIFPGIGLAVSAANITKLDDETMIVAAQTLADLVTPEDLEAGRVYPPLKNIRQVSLKIAIAVAEHAYAQKRTLSNYPDNLEKLISSHVYEP